MYDYYLQLSVAVVNDKTLKKILGGKKNNKKAKYRRKRAVATVFFRFSHRDKDGNPLKNKAQNSIIEIIKDDIVRKQKLLNFERDQAENTKAQDDEILNALSFLITCPVHEKSISSMKLKHDNGE